MTQMQRVLDYLWTVAPNGATNAEIAGGTGITPHQAVYMATQSLLRHGLVRSERLGRNWTFYGVEKIVAGPDHALSATDGPLQPLLNPLGFEALARARLERRYGFPLAPGKVANVPKLFDFVSPDGRIVGDAKYYTLVGGTRLPPAKFSAVAEHVWLLEQTAAPNTFLVFGNDRSVPVLWLKRYGHLVQKVVFYFLRSDGELEELHRPL
jgi:hypothetical protein